MNSSQSATVEAPDLFAPVDDESIDARFAKFDTENPAVWELFQKFAVELLRAGRTRYSADAICHRIRWHFAITTQSDDGFKLNDHFSSRYARKLIGADERFADFFETRRLKS